MERPHHTVRMLGPYGPEDNARDIAARMAEIQTEAWTHWLQAYGVSREVIEASLESDVTNEEHVAHREIRLREALDRTSSDEAVQYFGAFATNGEMVGFAKFYITPQPERAGKPAHLSYLLAEIDIVPEYQGYNAEHEADQRLAKKMIYAALAHVRDPNAVLQLAVLADNARARTLYEHLGLTIVSADAFEFEDAGGKLVRRARQFVMEGPLQLARVVLGAELADLQ